MWQHGVFVRLFVAACCAAAAMHLTMGAVDNVVIGVVAGLCGFLMGDHAAAAFV